eukprot:scaffold17418_cov66-Phaeocystis_antarctica.AAC.3
MHDWRPAASTSSLHLELVITMHHALQIGQLLPLLLDARLQRVDDCQLLRLLRFARGYLGQQNRKCHAANKALA